MSNITQITIANGIPTTGTGTVSTIDNLLALGVPVKGTTGLDYSSGKPTLPLVAANFAASGPYASYYLIATVQANTARNCISVENTSNDQIAIIRDDGVAANGATANNASVWSLAGATTIGGQGGSWSSNTFRGRIQVYSANSTAQVCVMGD